MQTRASEFALFLAVSAGLLGILGCGRNGPRTYPVQGKVALVGADIKLLAGSHVEFALTSDPTVRASGVIEADGRFNLQTMQAGVIVNGAREGKYDVRLILGDDDPQRRRSASEAVAQRFLDFGTSEVSFEVPTRTDMAFTVAPP